MRKKSRRLDLGLIFWIIAMLIILSITVYKHYQAVAKNRMLWKEYEKLEREIESYENEIDFMKHGGEK